MTRDHERDLIEMVEVVIAWLQLPADPAQGASADMAAQLQDALDAHRRPKPVPSRAELIGLMARHYFDGNLSHETRATLMGEVLDALIKAGAVRDAK